MGMFYAILVLLNLKSLLIFRLQMQNDSAILQQLRASE